MGAHADLGMAIGLWYMGLVFFCFYMAEKFRPSNVETSGITKTQKGMSIGFNLFFTGLGLFTILLGFAMGNAIFEAESINGTVGGILQVTYQVYMWVFIILFFFMLLDFIVWLLAQIRDTRMKGRVV